MNVNNQDSECTTFAQNCITNGLNFIMLSNDLFAKIAHHLNNNLDTEHEEIIGTGPDNLELRLDITYPNITLTLEDADTIIDSITFDGAIIKNDAERTEL